jgi:hypothetical protein
MWSDGLKTVNQDFKNLLLNLLAIAVDKETQNYAAKVVCLIVWIPELINDTVQELDSSLIVQLLYHLFE